MCRTGDRVPRALPSSLSRWIMNIRRYVGYRIMGGEVSHYTRCNYCKQWSYSDENTVMLECSECGIILRLDRRSFIIGDVLTCPCCGSKNNIEEESVNETA